MQENELRLNMLESLIQSSFEGRRHCSPLEGNDLNCVIGDINNMKSQFIGIASRIEVS